MSKFMESKTEIENEINYAVVRNKQWNQENIRSFPNSNDQ